MNIDQREFLRLPAGDNAFGALGNKLVRTGRLRDISMGGVALEYITKIDVGQKELFEIDIFVTGKNFFLADVPCSLAYDVEIDSPNSFTLPFVSRRCGVRFGTLTDAQVEQIRYFIENYTR